MATMLGLKVSINDCVVCLAAVPGKNQLQSTVVFGGTFDQPQIGVDGYIEKTPDLHEHLEWGKQHLKVGDKVTIQLVETDNPDKPIASSEFDSSPDREEMHRRIEEHIARLKLQIEEHGKEAVFPEEKGTFCSFCGKEKSEVSRLIGGPGSIHICSECIAICNDILSGKHKNPETGAWPERNA